MRRHQLIISLNQEQFLQVQRLAQTAGADTVGAYVRQQLLAVLGLEREEETSSEPELVALERNELRRFKNDLKRLRQELKLFSNDPASFGSASPISDGAQNNAGVAVPTGFVSGYYVPAESFNPSDAHTVIADQLQRPREIDRSSRSSAPGSGGIQPRNNREELAPQAFAAAKNIPSSTSSVAASNDSASADPLDDLLEHDLLPEKMIRPSVASTHNAETLSHTGAAPNMVSGTDLSNASRPASSPASGTPSSPTPGAVSGIVTGTASDTSPSFPNLEKTPTSANVIAPVTGSPSAYFDWDSRSASKAEQNGQAISHDQVHNLPHLLTPSQQTHAPHIGAQNSQFIRPPNSPSPAETATPTSPTGALTIPTVAAVPTIELDSASTMTPYNASTTASPEQTFPAQQTFSANQSGTLTAGTNASSFAGSSDWLGAQNAPSADSAVSADEPARSSTQPRNENPSFPGNVLNKVFAIDSSKSPPGASIASPMASEPQGQVSDRTFSATDSQTPNINQLSQQLSQQLLRTHSQQFLGPDATHETSSVPSNQPLESNPTFSSNSIKHQPPEPGNYGFDSSNTMGGVQGGGVQGAGSLNGNEVNQAPGLHQGSGFSQDFSQDRNQDRNQDPRASQQSTPAGAGRLPGTSAQPEVIREASPSDYYADAWRTEQSSASINPTSVNPSSANPSSANFSSTSPSSSSSSTTSSSSTNPPAVGPPIAHSASNSEHTESTSDSVQTDNPQTPGRPNIPPLSGGPPPRKRKL